MSEITREEVKQHVQRAVESWERRAEWCADRAAHGDPSGAPARAAALHTAAIYRLALAALEDAARWQQAAKQHAAWVMATPEFIAQMQAGWSDPVRVRITRRVAEDVLEFEAERHDCAAIDRARGG